MRRRHGDNGRRLTGAERLEIRRLTRSGEPYRVAAAAVGTTVRTVGRLMRATGGLPPRGSSRSPLRLSVAEREEISRALLAGGSLRTIARALGRAPSTISREVARNGGRRRYRAWRAETWASRRARRPRAAKLALARHASLRRSHGNWAHGWSTPRPKGAGGSSPSRRPSSSHCVCIGPASSRTDCLPARAGMKLGSSSRRRSGLRRMAQRSPGGSTGSWSQPVCRKCRPPGRHSL